MSAATIQKIILEMEARGVSGSRKEIEQILTAFDKGGDKAERYSNRLETLTRTLDPLGKALEQRARLQDLTNKRLEAELGLEDKHVRALANAEAAVRRAQQTHGVNDNGQRGLGRYDWINLSRQFQDIAVSIAGGQRPLTVLLQQGAQISDIFGASAGGPTAALKDFGKYALWLATNPLTILTATLGTLLFAANKTTSALTELGQESEKTGIKTSTILGARTVGATSGLDNKAVDEALSGAAKQFEQFKRNGGEVLDFIKKFDKSFLGVADSARNAEQFIKLVAQEAQRLGGEQGLDLAQRLLGADQGRALMANMAQFVDTVGNAAQPIDAAARKAADLEKAIAAAAQKADTDMLSALQALGSPVESLKLSWYGFIDGIAVAISNIDKLRRAMSDMATQNAQKLSEGEEGAAVGRMLNSAQLRGRLVGIGPTPFEQARSAFFAAGPQFSAGGLSAGSSRQAYADAMAKTKTGKSDAEKELETYQKITKELENQIRLDESIGEEHKRIQEEIDKQNWIEKLGTKATQEHKEAVGALVDRLEAAKRAQEAFAERQKIIDASLEMVRSTAEDLGSALVDVFRKGENAGKAFQSVLDRLLSSLLNKSIDSLVNGLLTGNIAGKTDAASGGGGFLGSIVGGLGKLFGFADGGIMTSAGPLPLRMYAGGGVANSPQAAIFGEGRRPEAFVPLPDGRHIPVAMSGSQGGAKITINNMHGGADVSARQLSDGEILITVNKLIDQKMKAQVPGIVANSQRRAM